MELAIDNSYFYEQLSWLGDRTSKPELWKYPTIKADGSTNINGFVEFKKKSVDKIKISATGWEFEGRKELAKENNKSEGRKAGDIIIYPNREQFKNNNNLKIISPLTDKNMRPITFRNEKINYLSDNKLFLDMVNKEVIEGEGLIAQYHQQLPIIQRYTQGRGQSFSLVYGKYGENEVFNNSLVWQN